MKKLLSLLIVVLFTECQFSFSQDFVLPLYIGEIPNSKNTGQKEKMQKEDITVITNVQEPDIAVYLPSKRFATGQAVVICPGGGYWVLAYDLEGTDIARYLNCTFCQKANMVLDWALTMSISLRGRTT